MLSESDCTSGLFDKAKAKIIPVTTTATPKIIKPTLGWKIIHETVTAIKNRGMHTITAAIKIMIPTVPLRIPPTRGIYPNKMVMGEKNIQIPATMRIKDNTLTAQVRHFTFHNSCSIIS